MASEYLFSILKLLLETFFRHVRDLFYIQEIRDRILTVGSTTYTFLFFWYLDEP